MIMRKENRNEKKKKQREKEKEWNRKKRAFYSFFPIQDFREIEREQKDRILVMIHELM